MPNLIPAVPELAVAGLSLALLMLGAFRRGNANRSLSWLAVLVLGLAGLLASTVVADAPVTTFGGQFVMDGFAVFMKWLVLIGAALTLVMSLDFNERENITQFEYPILMLFAALGMMMLVSANDMIALYVGIELQSLALYVTAAIRRDSLRSSEAALKYFVLGALSSGMLLYGASLLYGYAGTTSFAGLAEVFRTGAPPVGAVVGLVFVLAGLAFKVSAVPFHMWTPDVYEGAPTPVTAFFSVAPKIAAVALLVRVMVGPFGELVAQWQQIVVALSIASMALGALAAIWQTNIKRLMAYSSIGHVGFALVGLATGTEDGVRGVLVYMAIYLAMNLGTFCCILCMRRDGRMVESIGELAGLSRTQPALALALAIFMFSMAGIPPLAGFFAKLYVFMAAVEAGLFGLAVTGVLASVVAAFYYLRIVKLMYFDAPSEAFDRPITREIGTILVGTGVFTLFFFLYPTPVLDGAAAAAAVLFPG